MQISKTTALLITIIVLLLGVIIGLIIKETSKETRLTSRDPVERERTSGNQSSSPPESSSGRRQTDVPQIDFESTPEGKQIEWINKNDDGSGYTLYFERKIKGLFILEKCRAYTYKDDAGRPAAPKFDFCLPNKLQGSISDLNDSQILVTTKEGKNLTFDYKTSGKNDDISLHIAVNDEKLVFKLGNKNDLLQYFESLPETVKAREEFHRYAPR